MQKMNKLLRLCILSVTLLATAASLLPAKKKTPELTDQYRRWFHMVEYIITGEERGTFLKLTNDRDREVFVSLFWNLRDPTPGTEKNEFKEEHLRRFQYANRYFKYGTPREGWKTDMGRIYIIMGEPDGKNNYHGDSAIYPAEIWSYYGKKRTGLPASFHILFWKEHGMGEFKIFDPSVNTPGELVRRGKGTHDIAITDTQGNYQVLLQEHPELARASLSLVPDEVNYDFTPSLRSRELLNRVIRFPQRQINDSYASNFLKYKGKVEVDYSINYVESKHNVMVSRDPGTGMSFIHFSMKPRKFSAQSTGDGNTFAFNIMMSVSLYKDKLPVFEYRKRFPYSGERDQVLKDFYNSMLISDFFPAPEGSYRLSVLLQNQVSKEFTFFDTKVTVPPARPAKPMISGLLLSKEVKTLHRRVYVPFKFRELEVTPDPAREFGTKDAVTAVFTVERGNYRNALEGMIEVTHLAGEKKYLKQYPFTIAAEPNLDVRVHTLSQSLEAMPAGYYQMQLRLAGQDGAQLAQVKQTFTVSFKSHVPGTTHLFKTISAGNRFLYYHILGIQYMRLKQLDKARQFLSTALNLRPGYGRLVKDYCGLLMEMKQYDKTLETAEQLKGNPRDRFDYLAIKGKAFFHKALYAEAVTHLAEANRIYDSDVSVLNVLGFAYLKRGNKAEARKVFKASLLLNGKQKHIQNTLAGL
jgi:GWxTD domain-containing protein